VSEKLTQLEIDAILTDFPRGRGWSPGVGHWPDGTWDADLRRATPRGPDIVYCGRYATEREAWVACVERAKAMVTAWESGDTALMALLRASIAYAEKSTPEEWADMRRFWREAIGAARV